MKTVILFGLLLASSCATVSEYNQGCRDGITKALSYIPNNSYYESTKVFCNDLDKIHKLEKKEYE